MWTNQKLHLISNDKGCVHFLLLSTNERLSSRWPSQHKIGFIDTSSVIEKLMNLLITCLGFTLSPATGVLCFNFSGQVSFFCKTFMVQCSFTPCYVSNYFISDQFIMSNKNYKLFCLCSGLKVDPDLVLHRKGEKQNTNTWVLKTTTKTTFQITRPSVMEVSPQTFGLSKSILLIDHRIAGDHRLAGIDSLNLV